MITKRPHEYGALAGRNGRRKACLRRWCTILLAVWTALSRGAENTSEEAENASNQEPLSELSLEDLANIEVTSVAKKAQKLSHAAAAVHVITQDDINRSGATSIPEALRLVPGMEVARVDSHSWAISARGFNESFGNKLLVLIDGRSVYTPLFSGVFWDVQDTLLEDIDRIEVIRGPGGTIWGANAVNGVVNIITRSAHETQGTLLMGGAGTEEIAFGGVRYGGKLSETAAYRVYGKYLNRDESLALAPGMGGGEDDWEVYRGGMRIDWDPSLINTFTLQGDVYDGNKNRTIGGFPRDVHVFGGNVLGRWTRYFENGSDLQVQAYYDRTEREQPILDEDRNTLDLALDHRSSLGERQEVVWGLGYRFMHDHQYREIPLLSFDPACRMTHLFGGFVQDEVALVADQLKLTVGTKLEHNDYTGFELQPSARLLWIPAEHHSVWAAVSRAVRTPSRTENDINLLQPRGLISGNRDFESEDVLAFEAGYRVQPRPRVSIDLAAFYNRYEDLRSVEPVGPGLFVFGNLLRGEGYGSEIVLSYRPVDRWLWRASYSLLELDLHPAPGGGDSGEAISGNSPHHQAWLRSSVDLPGNLSLDWMVRYVDNLSLQGIPSYVTMDVRLGWRPAKNLEISFVAQNLLDDRHPEFISTAIPNRATEVQRGFYGKVTWQF